MIQSIEITLLPAELDNKTALWQKAMTQLGLSLEEITDIRIIKRSVDARSAHPIFRLQLEVYVAEQPAPEPVLLAQLKDVSEAPEVIIVGAGPGGLFAALELIELGLKPVVLTGAKMYVSGGATSGPYSSLER